MDKRSFIRQFFQTLHKLIFSRGTYQLDLPALILKVHPRSSALLIVWETFVTNIYRPTHPIGSIKTVIDLGAYIGDFSLWAAREFCPEKIISVEPKSNLHQILTQNIEINAFSGIIHPLNRAIYSHRTRLKLNKVIQDASANFHEESSSGVETITLENLLRVYKINIVDYLKMDIEGGEKFVLTKANQAIFRHKVRFVSAEIHNKWGFTKNDALEYFASLGYHVIERPIIGPYAQLEAYNLNLLPKHSIKIQPKLSTFNKALKVLGF